MNHCYNKGGTAIEPRPFFQGEVFCMEKTLKYEYVRSTIIFLNLVIKEDANTVNKLKEGIQENQNIDLCKKGV